jgi:hypothetical protein
MILEQLCIADVASQSVHRLMAGHVSIILKIEAPLPAAEVRKPGRSE